MSQFENLASMMLIPGNIRKWKPYLYENFLAIKDEPIENVIDQIDMERSFIMDESAWSHDDRIKRLTATIKSKLEIKNT